MGFDCFMEVIGKCSLEEFIKITRDNFLKTLSEIQKDEIINKVKEWAAITNNRTLFIENIEEINFDNFDLHVGYYQKDDGDDENDDDDGFHLMNYSILILCEIILLAIDKEDDKLTEYLAVFNEVENLSVKRNNVKITLYYESSYKGYEKLEIDYYKLSQEIIQIKQIYHSIQVYTKLGMS